MDLFFLSSHWLIPTIYLVLLIPILSLSLLLKQRVVKKETNLPPPGPPKLPIIGNLHQLGFLHLHHRFLWKLSQKYGPTMLLQLGGVQTVVISSPEMAKELLKIHDIECCTRPLSQAQKKLTYNYLTIGFSPYNDSWREMRKLFMIELFSTKRVESFKHIRKAMVGKLINSIYQASPNPVDLRQKALSLTYSVICQIAFSQGYEEIDESNFNGFMEEALEVFGMISTVDILPWLGVGGIVDRIMGIPRQIEKCYQKFDSFFERLLDDHLDPARQRPEHEDVVDVMLRISKDENAQFSPTKEHIKAVLMDILVAGIDTSSITITWAMTELARNPRVMKKVQAEIRSCVVRCKEIVDESELEKLDYLRMVVKETLRLHPPAPLLAPREAISHFKIGGYDIKPKTRIILNAWAIARHPQNWKNPDEFYPERFEDNDIDFKGQNFEFIPFGSGRRMCPGITMGHAVIMVTLANLLYCFDWEMPNGMTTEDISLEEGIGLNVRKKSPLYLVPMRYDFENTKASFGSLEGNEMNKL